MKLSTYQISFTFGGLTIRATKKLTPNKFKKILKKMQNANYIVRDVQNKKRSTFIRPSYQEQTFTLTNVSER